MVYVKHFSIENNKRTNLTQGCLTYMCMSVDTNCFNRGKPPR